MGGLSPTVELMLPVQNKCSNTNALRGVNKQTDSWDVEQRHAFVKKQSLFLVLEGNGKFN